MASGEPTGAVQLAVEPNYGSFPAATNEQIPDESGNAYEVPEIEKGTSFFSALEQGVFEVDIERSTEGRHPVEVETQRTIAGALIDKFSMSIALRMPIRGILTAGAGINHATWDTHPVGWILNSGMEGNLPTAATDAVNGVAVSANRFTATVAGNFDVGQLIAVVIDGEIEFSTVTGKAAADIIHSPAFSRQLTNVTTDVVWLLHTWTSAVSGVGTLGSSISAKFHRLGRMYTGYGGRMTGFTISTPGERRTLVFEPTIQFPFVRPDDEAVPSTWPLDPVIDVGADSAKYIGAASGAIISDAIDHTALAAGTAAELARNALQVQGGWSLSYQNEMHVVDIGALLPANMEVDDVEATLDVTATPSAILDAMRLNRQERQVLIGCGPSRLGQGFCLAMQAANLTGTPLRDDSQKRLVQSAQFRPGPWRFDDSAVRPGRTDIRIGMPIV